MSSLPNFAYGASRKAVLSPNIKAQLVAPNDSGNKLTVVKANSHIESFKATIFGTLVSAYHSFSRLFLTPTLCYTRLTERWILSTCLWLQLDASLSYWICVEAMVSKMVGQCWPYTNRNVMQCHCRCHLRNNIAVHIVFHISFSARDFSFLVLDDPLHRAPMGKPNPKITFDRLQPMRADTFIKSGSIKGEVWICGVLAFGIHWHPFGLDNNAEHCHRQVK